MPKFGVGQPASRIEDQRFLTGHGRYIADLELPGQLYGAVLRSPHAHAALRAVDTSAAEQAPGVVAVITGEDLARDGIGHLPCVLSVKNRDGTDAFVPPRPALARDQVRHVGDPVAMVVAESTAQAGDALELIEVDYEMLDAITDAARALEDGAPQIWEQAPHNLCFDWELGDAAATDEAFRGAARVVELDLINNRVIANPMETRGAIGSVEPDTGRLVLHVSSQGSHLLRGTLAETVFQIPQEQMRVITHDVGGGFGVKIFAYPEYVMVLYAARRLGRPVKWIAERSETFLGDCHARDHVSHAEMALDDEGRFVGMRVRTVANMGAYLSDSSPFIATEAGTGMLAGCYTTPAIHASVRGVFTNTNPTDAYRGAGRPEAAYLLERLVDKCGRVTGLGPVEIRRRNFIRSDQMPFSTALGKTYDTGDFARNMDDALELAEWDGFEARRREARARNRLRGIGLSTYIEACAGNFAEAARLQVDADGGVTVMVGTQSNGQGHATAYTQIVCEQLGLEPARVTVVQGDTDRVASGFGTLGSRSIPVGGTAIRDAADQVIVKGREQAAHMLEAAAADIEFTNGTFRIVGTDREISFQEVARAADPGDGRPSFDENAEWEPAVPTFPNGTHVCELEVDRDTGAVELLRYTVVDDFGVALNPKLLEGQVHGGVAQGAGQALLERCAYEDDSGQLLSASFMDYTLPRADLVPPLAFKLNRVPSTTNPMGMKGAGEAGAIGAPPAIINAIVEALSELGVEHVEMPATPHSLWRLMQRHG